MTTVEAEKKELQENYTEVMQKASRLETELDEANNQLRLLEGRLRTERGIDMYENGQTFAIFS